MPVRRSVKFLGFLVGAAVIVVGAKAIASKTSLGTKVADAAKGTAAKSIASSSNEFNGVPVLKLCVNTWGGYAGAQYFNNGFKPNEQSRYWTQYHLPVEFIKIDDDASISAWQADQCQVHYGTVGSFLTRLKNILSSDPQVFLQPDWSYGGDVAIATAQVHSVKDLKNLGGRKGKVALWVGSPSHELLNNMLDAAGMTQNDIEVISAKDAFDAKKIFQGGQSDVAIIWSPDDQDLMHGDGAVPGAHVLTSTKQCANCIADIMFAKKSFIESHQAELKALAEGWFKGAAEINTDPAAKAAAVKVLTVGLEQPEDFVKTAIDNARLTTYGDNVNFFNLKGGYTGVTGKSIYDDQGRKFRAIGQVEGELPDWSQVVNTSILRSISMPDASQMAEKAMTFSKPDAVAAKAEAFAEKAISIEFPTGSSTLTEQAKIKIDTDVSNAVKRFTGARIRIEGNTDNVGSDAVNVPLSQRRAKAVSDYLIGKYGYDRNRFIVLGNGSQVPTAGCESNATDDCRAKNRRTDIQFVGAP